MFDLVSHGRSQSRNYMVGTVTGMGRRRHGEGVKASESVCVKSQGHTGLRDTRSLEGQRGPRGTRGAGGRGQPLDVSAEPR